jgi:predicted acyl esterase
MSTVNMPQQILLPKRETLREVTDHYIKIKNLYIPMRDGIELCANVFLPFGATKSPTIMSMCPYGKDTHVFDWGQPFTDIYVKMYKKLEEVGPDVTCEALDPLFWVSLSIK